MITIWSPRWVRLQVGAGRRRAAGSSEELPEDSRTNYVDNEFLHQDVNKWTQLARDATGVGTLMQATGGHAASSDP